MKMGETVYYLVSDLSASGSRAMKVYKAKILTFTGQSQRYVVEILEPVFGTYYSFKKGDVRSAGKQMLFKSLDEVTLHVKHTIIDITFKMVPEGYRFHNIRKLTKTMFDAGKEK